MSASGLKADVPDTAHPQLVATHAAPGINTVGDAFDE